MPFTTKAKYYDIKNRIWRETEVSIDKKLNFDYSACTWFSIDGEFTGLYPQRDRDVLWTVASEDGEGNLRVEMIYTFEDDADLTTLKELLQSNKEKYLFYGQLDLAFLYKRTGLVIAQPLFDVKVVSKVVRTYTNDHSVDLMVKSFAGIDEDIFPKRDMAKSKEFANHPTTWSKELHQYNVNDVVYLKFIAENLKEMAKRLNREAVVDAINLTLPNLGVLSASGYYRNVFDHMYNDTDMTGAIIPRR
jgi:ribonuclease D